MPYRKSTKKIALREKEMLERTPGDPNDPAAPYNQVAPGLYPDETLVEVAGHLVAMSVERHWLPNGAGIGFHGYARVIEDDGSTSLSPLGYPIEAALSFTASPLMLKDHSGDAIATDVAKIMLEEPADLTIDLVDEDGKKTGETMPLINLSEDVIHNASIVAQVLAMNIATRSTIKL